MVYRKDNRIKKHHNRSTILAIILGVSITFMVVGSYVNYKEPIINNVTQIKDTAVSEIKDVISTNNINSKPTIDTLALETRIHDLINKQRAQNNLSPLALDVTLSTIARNHSQDMVTNDYFEHTSLDGKTVDDRYNDAGYQCSSAGENIFENNLYNSYETTNGIISKYDWNSFDELASSTVQGWMQSQGHKDNILYPQYQHEGIGIVISAKDKVLITEDFC